MHSLLLTSLLLTSLTTALSMSCIPPTTLTLARTADKMPSIGFGLWKLTNVTEVVQTAISKGWRHFDSACDYGNEVEVGAGLAQGLVNSGLKREDLWVTSKLWNTFHHPDHVEMACR